MDGPWDDLYDGALRNDEKTIVKSIDLNRDDFNDDGSDGNVKLSLVNLWMIMALFTVISVIICICYKRNFLILNI